MLPVDPNRAHALSPAGTEPAVAFAASAAMVMDAEPAKGLPPALSAESMGSALLQAAKRRWAVALSLGLLAAAGAVAAVVFLMPAQYQVQAKIQVSSRPPAPLLGGGEGGNDTDFLAYQRTQSALLVSKPVILAALRKPEVAACGEIKGRPYPAEWLAKSLQVDSLLGPELLRVSLSGDDDEELPVIVNALVQAYLDDAKDADDGRRRERLETLRANRGKFAADLERQKKRLRDWEERFHLEDPKVVDLRYGKALDKAGQIERDVMQNRLTLESSQNELAHLEDLARKPVKVEVTPGSLEDYLRTDVGYQAMVVQRSKLEEEIEKTDSAVESVREGMVREIQGRIKALEERMAGRRREVRPVVELVLQTKAVDDLRTNLDKLRVQVSFLKKQKEILAVELENAQEQLRGLRSGQKVIPEVEKLRDQVAQADQVLRKVDDQIGTLNMEPTLPARARVLEAAEVPTKKTVDRQVKIAGVAGGGMFFLVVGLVSFLEYRSRRVYAVNDVVHGLGLNLMGTVPALPASRARTGARNFPWQALLTESIDAIRTRLLHAAQRDGLRTVMVTSAGGGEGKTSLASHLASSLARAGRKTLLLDGDLRHPAVHKQFQLPLTPGFSEVLRGEASAEEVIRPTAITRLEFMPAGSWDAEAVQALAQERVRDVFEFLKGRYDFIILDSSPVLPVADAMLLGQHADGVLFSVFRDVSRIPSVYAAHQRLATLGIRTLGTVVIGAGAEVDGSTYLYPAAATT